VRRKERVLGGGGGVGVGSEHHADLRMDRKLQERGVRRREFRMDAPVYHDGLLAAAQCD